MSHTVSRGFHNASRWLSPALAVEEYMEDLEKRIPLGALVALDQFFTWVLAGISRDERKLVDSRIPVMAGVCAFSIATNVFDNAHQSVVRRQTERLSVSVRKLRDGKGLSPTESTHLRRFLAGLIRQGKRTGPLI